MVSEKVDAWREAGAHLYANSDRLLDDLANAFVGGADNAAA